MEIKKEVLVSFIGSYGCGKTSVIRRYFPECREGEKFYHDGAPTKGGWMVYTKTIEQHPMGLKQSSLKVYDAGHSLNVRDEVGSGVMDAIVVCADVTNESSIKMALLYNMALFPVAAYSGPPGRDVKKAMRILCLTKTETFSGTWAVPLAEIKAVNVAMPLPFDEIIQTSAGHDVGCRELFDDVIRPHLDKWFD